MSTIIIKNATVFDGETNASQKTVEITDGLISSIYEPHEDIPADNLGTIIDGTECTLIPGLIDAHVHTSQEALTQALAFGVTTELEMMGGIHLRRTRGTAKR